MANGKLYAFRLRGTAHVWVLLGERRAWIRSATMAAEHQVDLSAEAELGGDSPLWLLPVTGPLPS